MADEKLMVPCTINGAMQLGSTVTNIRRSKPAPATREAVTAYQRMMGLPETGKGGRNLAETLETELTEFLDGAGRKILANDDKMDEALRKIVRQVAMEEIGKKPEVVVVVSRLAAE